VKRKLVVCLLSCGLSILAVACAAPAPQAAPDTRAADEAAIRAADLAWSKAAEARQAEAFVAYYTPDAILLPPNEPLATGHDAALKIIGDLMAMPGFSLAWQTSRVEVARAGDLAYSQGAYRMTFNDAKGNPVNDTGKYLEIWKKQADGQWKCIADMFNSDLPAAPPAK
jgi:ketosteroid isomerase-like protein